MAEVIIGLVGSLRQGSFNRLLLGACVPLLAPSFTLEIHGLDGIPLYDADARTRERLQAYVAGFEAFVRGRTAAAASG